MPYQDRTLTCVDCGADFTFTADDQDYHARKGFTNEPRRCPTCRAARRTQGGGGGGYGGGGGGYGGGGGGYGGQREMFKVTCARCGQEAEVPFQPRGDKPVYCSNCFRSNRPAGGGGGGGGRSGGSSRW